MDHVRRLAVEEEVQRLKMKARVEKLPAWAQAHIADLEAKIEAERAKTRQVEKMLPWVQPGMNWLTLLYPGQFRRDPLNLHTCDRSGTRLFVSIGPDDWLFLGRDSDPRLRQP